MTEMHNRPTMEDVAREAGVALGTVSKVVNNQRVGEKYRLTVEKAIEKLGYRYNTSGRALRTNQTGIVALIIPNMHPYFALLTHHINLALSKRNYRMLLFLTEANHSKELECIQLAAENRVDGIIALTYNPSLDVPKDIRLVTIDRFFSKDIPCVASDNFEGGRLAVHKLYELGCRKVAMLFSCSSLRNEPSKRRDGFVSACEELGLSYGMKIIEEPVPCELLSNTLLEPVKYNRPDFEQLDAFLLDHIHDGQLDFDGLFCGTDFLACRVRRFLKGQGIRVPEDVQIIGFDGIQSFIDNEYISSTIVQPVPEIAETCVSTILSDDFSSRPSLICLPVEFADGGTTKKMP